MRKWTTIAFAMLLLALVVQIIFGFPLNIETQPEEETLKLTSPKKDNQAEQHMEGVHLVESESGNRDWELFASSAEGFEGKGYWQLKNVKVQFYSDEELEFTVTGETGLINSKTKDMEFKGNVYTRSKNGYQFQSESVFYNSKTRIISSPNDIKMMGPSDQKEKGMTLTGNKMMTNVNDSKMKIESNVKAFKQLKNGKKFEITSHSAEFSSKDNSAKFIENVKIQVDSMQMEGPEAQFQYKSGSDFLQSILLKGGVKVSDYDKFATSESVFFDPDQDQFVFKGKPRVVQNNDEIIGDQIIFYEGGKKVRVEKIRGNVEKK